MVRLLIEDVTLLRGEQVSIGICFRGGATRSLTIPAPLPPYRTWQTPPNRRSDRSAARPAHRRRNYGATQREGLRSGKGGCFRGTIIGSIRRGYHLKSRYNRLRAAGMLTVNGIAKARGISTITAYRWRRLGILKAHAYNDKSRYLFQPPSGPKRVPWCGKKLSDPQRFGKVCSPECERGVVCNPILRLAVPREHAVLRSRRRCVRQRRAWGWLPGGPGRDSSVETTGAPKFLGNLNCPFAHALRLRRDSPPQTIRGGRAALGIDTPKAPATNDFRSSMTWLLG